MKDTERNLDSEVWERLPYWIRELFKIIEKAKGGSANKGRGRMRGDKRG